MFWTGKLESSRSVTLTSGISRLGTEKTTSLVLKVLEQVSGGRGAQPVANFAVNPAFHFIFMLQYHIWEKSR